MTDRTRTQIQVTEADIAKAHRKNSVRCVVVQAIARTIPDASRIDVDIQTIRWSRAGERFIYLTPYSTQGYIIAFDAGEEIQPFTFVLDERRRVPVQTRRRTAAGAEVLRAERKHQRAKKKQQQLELTAAGKTEPAPEPAERKKAKIDLPAARGAAAEAEQALADTKAAYAGAVLQQRVGEGRTDPPRRVHKSSERVYGSRRLRLNQ